VTVLSLRKGLAAIGESPGKDGALAVRARFAGRMPSSLQQALAGMTDPGVAAWSEVGHAFGSYNNDDSDNAQGMATDGQHWFLISNNSKRAVMFDNGSNRLRTIEPGAILWQLLRDDQYQGVKPPSPSDPDYFNAVTAYYDWGPGSDSPHFGAGSYYNGSLYIPVQNPMGVWRVVVDGGEQYWHSAPKPPPDGNTNMFPWCAIYPVNGLLYTSNYDSPTVLYAYSVPNGTALLEYTPKENIHLPGPYPLPLDGVQGGTFTQHGRVILVRYSFEAVFCFSALNGFCLGAQQLDGYSETEAVVVRKWPFDGAVAYVHILESFNTSNGCVLHSYAVPDPVRL
jgi:hypothetical protein